MGYDVLKFFQSEQYSECDLEIPVSISNLPARDKLDQVWNRTHITRFAKTPDQRNGEEYEDISCRVGLAIPPISATRDDRSSQFAIWGGG